MYTIYGSYGIWKKTTPPKTNIDTQHDGLEKVVPALNTAMFDISVKFFGGYTFSPQNPAKSPIFR